MFKSLKYFVWLLSRRIIRIESTGKGTAIESQAVIGEKRSMRERHLCTIFTLYTNSFCHQRAGIKVLTKVTSKADRWKESEKSFPKNWFLIFFNNKKCFLLHVFEVFLPNLNVCNLQPAVSSFAAHGHKLLVVHGHKLEQQKLFFNCVWSLPYIWEKNIHTRVIQ